MVFAHRGSSEALPEHTLGAYLRAVDEGADGLECDVRLTRDGHLVCLHDRRLERTSNGRGVVSAHTLAELNRLDFGSWHPQWPDSADDLILDRPGGREAHASVLTLERLLDAALGAGRPIRLLIETKHPTRFGHAVEERLVAVLRRYGLERPGPGPVQVTVMSFSPGALRRLRQLAPELPTVLLMELLPPWLRDGRLPSGIGIAGPGVRLLRNHPRLAERLHNQGNRLYVWTVNTAADVDLVLALGADGIISDRPRFVLDRLGR
ncbi:glycerophosphoryl diester phosphodiesterase [Rugosimonospora africana]|uniref:Glycerophosphoryl diester phosphodiesterase n=1 Tax=Rugosimonospora africana TaxID=556532 RepID=A0A8J3QM41_9ACTN|nr:glycerophosphoryl diester phosphodiesterase [Rugosimonospora africana]